MRSTMDLNSRKIIESSNVKYTLDEVCPCCGRYTPNGEVCIRCQKEYKVYELRVHCREN